MAYTYKVMHLDQTQHNLKYKYGTSFTPTEITYHQTSNNASALNERNYLNNRTDNVYIGFHIVVDDQMAIECLPLNVQTWHAGDGSTGAGNMKSIGIEMAYSTSSDISLRNAAIENGAKVIASLMKTYNIPMAKVLPHQARSGKHCPHDILDRYGNEVFRVLIQTEYQKLTESTTTPSTPLTPVNFSVGDSVEVLQTISGYSTSLATKASTSVSAGTYKVYKVASNGLHAVNISKTGTVAGAWVNATDLKKNNKSLSVGNQVQLNTAASGYKAATSAVASSLLASGKYIVFKVSDGSPHSINLSKSGIAPGAWVDETNVSFISTQSFNHGEQVEVVKRINGYGTSTTTIATTSVNVGTYYVYKYVEGATHALNISKLATTPGSWVNISDLMLV